MGSISLSVEILGFDVLHTQLLHLLLISIRTPVLQINVHLLLIINRGHIPQHIRNSPIMPLLFLHQTRDFPMILLHLPLHLPLIIHLLLIDRKLFFLIHLHRRPELHRLPQLPRLRLLPRLLQKRRIHHFPLLLYFFSLNLQILDRFHLVLLDPIDPFIRMKHALIEALWVR